MCWAAREERERNDLYSRNNFPKRQNLRLGSPVGSVNVVKTERSTPRTQRHGDGWMVRVIPVLFGSAGVELNSGWAVAWLFSFAERHTWKRSRTDAGR